MRNSIARYGVASAIVSFLCADAIAGPVTSSDLSGNSICFKIGVDSFMRGGRFFSTIYGDGTWEIAPGGVEIDAERFVGLLPLEKLADGKFLAHLGSATLVGKYCDN
jgi:hypothetical protein